jgi:hypothetical protein
MDQNTIGAQKMISQILVLWQMPGTFTKECWKISEVTSESKSLWPPISLTPCAPSKQAIKPRNTTLSFPGLSYRSWPKRNTLTPCLTVDHKTLNPEVSCPLLRRKECGPERLGRIWTEEPCWIFSGLLLLGGTLFVQSWLSIVPGTSAQSSFPCVIQSLDIKGPKNCN